MLEPTLHTNYGSLKLSNFFSSKFRPNCKCSACIVIYNQSLELIHLDNSPTRASSPCLSDEFPALFRDFKLIAHHIFIAVSIFCRFLFSEKKKRKKEETTSQAKREVGAAIHTNTKVSLLHSKDNKAVLNWLHGTIHTSNSINGHVCGWCRIQKSDTEEKYATCFSLLLLLLLMFH